VRDHLVAAPLAEVDVDVRHGDPSGFRKRSKSRSYSSGSMSVIRNA